MTASSPEPDPPWLLTLGLANAAVPLPGLLHSADLAALEVALDTWEEPGHSPAPPPSDEPERLPPSPDTPPPTPPEPEGPPVSPSLDERPRPRRRRRRRRRQQVLTPTVPDDELDHRSFTSPVLALPLDKPAAHEACPVQVCPDPTWQPRKDRVLLEGRADERLPLLVVPDRTGGAHGDSQQPLVRRMQVLRFLWYAKDPAGAFIAAAEAAAVTGLVMMIGVLTVTGPVRGLAAGLLLRGLTGGGGSLPRCAQQLAGLALALWLGISATQVFDVAKFAAQFIAATADRAWVRRIGLMMVVACSAQPDASGLHITTVTAAVLWLTRPQLW